MVSRRRITLEKQERLGVRGMIEMVDVVELCVQSKSFVSGDSM